MAYIERSEESPIFHFQDDIFRSRTFSKMVGMYLGNVRIGYGIFWEDDEVDDTIYLDTLFIEPKFRKQGYGSILLEHMKNIVMQKYPSRTKIMATAFHMVSKSLLENSFGAPFFEDPLFDKKLPKYTDMMDASVLQTVCYDLS
jgi:GNAT superfamily N-acetyltransferase